MASAPPKRVAAEVNSNKFSLFIIFNPQVSGGGWAQIARAVGGGLSFETHPANVGVSLDYLGAPNYIKNRKRERERGAVSVLNGPKGAVHIAPKRQPIIAEATK